MEIRIRNTGEVMTEITFRTKYRDRVIPDQLTEEWLGVFNGGADIVFEGPQATTTPPYEFSFRSGVEQQADGKWYTKYSVGPVFTDRPATDTEPAKTAAEQEAEHKAMKDAEQAKNVRADRTKRLADSDWTQIADSTADKAAWAAHRQALRDITSQAGFPWTIEWPEQP
jgi:hypothetical protein